MGGEVLGDRGAGRDHPRVHGVAGLGVLDGVAEDGVQRQGAVVAQQGQPGADGARDRRGEEAGSGDQLEVQFPEGVDRRAGGGDPLTGQDGGGPGPARARVPSGEEDGNLTAGPVEVGLDDLEGQPGGDGGVEGVAAALEDRHACGGGQPVGGGDHAEGAGQLGAGGEHAATVEEGPRCPPPLASSRRGPAPGPTARAPGYEAGGAGTSAAAGEDATGWIVGVLGSSRSTTGPSTARGAGAGRRGGRAGDHDARCSPSTPAPHSASRRVTAPSEARSPGRAGGSGTTTTVISGTGGRAVAAGGFARSGGTGRRATP